MRRTFEWLFRNRQTGRITVAQFPNWSLGLWGVASVALRLGDASGWLHTLLVIVASAALAVWAGDEVVRGVNPFRRLLGSAALAWLIYSLITR